jgi:subtilisin family serine protease
MAFIFPQSVMAGNTVRLIPSQEYAAHPDALSLVTPNDEYFYRQWHSVNDGKYTMGGVFTPKADADIDMDEAWEIEQGDSSVIVAILDTGIKLSHKEFEGRIWINSGEIPENGKDDDGNGFKDDVNGWDFINNDNDPNDDAYDGHGTSMTGIIGANANNSAGYAGINWHCKLMAVKVADEGGYITSPVVANGIIYAVDNGADIISMSLIFMDSHTDVEEAIEYAASKDVVVVCCSGNQAKEWIGFPASLSSTIAVGASNPDDTRAEDFGDGSGSNWGPELDVVAPGAHIARVGVVAGAEYTEISSGTSEATAFVSGLASLIISHNPSISPEDCKRIICETAEDEVGDPKEDTPGWDKYYGYGRINANKALLAVENTSSVAKSCSESVSSQKIQFVGKNKIMLTSSFRSNLQDVRIFTSQGRDVTGMVSKISDGKNRITFNIEKLPAGNYLCRAGSEGHAVISRFVAGWF